MNVDTGQIYRGDEVDAARERGETLIPLTEGQAARLSAQTPDSRIKNLDALRREYAEWRQKNP